MNTRERFKAVMNFQPFDRFPIVEWAGWWDKTVERWHKEGLPVNLSDRYEINRYLGMDIYKQIWVPVRTQKCPGPVSYGAPIIHNLQEYQSISKYLYPSLSDESKNFFKNFGKEQEKGEIVLWFTLDGFFWFARTLLGIEPHLYSFYDQTELIHKINNDLSNWMIKIIEEICSICIPDFMTFAEDMSYNNGPMISKEIFDEFMAPYYRKIVPIFKKWEILSIIDSDGNITIPASWFEEVDLDGILPLERQSGLDIVKLRADHPKMRFIGHFDKMTMNKGEQAMRKEFERLLPVASKGGFIISCDHQTPPGVSYQDYLLYLRLFKEYAYIK
jgi:hypothetical protein